MKCKVCGAEIQVSERFCSNCGESNNYYLDSDRSMISRSEQQTKSSSNLKRTTAAKITGFYCIAFSVLSLMNGNYFYPRFDFTLILHILMIVFGLLVTIFVSQDNEKGYLTVLFVIICIYGAFSLDHLFLKTDIQMRIWLFLIHNTMIITPFVYCLIYFKASRKDD
jgi:hypothetical protein